MDYASKLTRRFSQLNVGKSAVVEPIHVHEDGHGTYIWTATRGRRGTVLQQFFVNPAEARSLARGKFNKNLDSQLRL